MKNISNNNGVTMIELLVTMTIFLFITGGLITTLNAGQRSWQATSTQIQMHENILRVLDKVSKELRESGENAAGVLQVSINDGTGPNGSDILQFAIPVICESGVGMINSSGIANWGATTQWGCSSLSCMDFDGFCATLEYSAIQYRIDANNRFIRNVIDGVGNVFKTDVFANNVTDFQAQFSADQNVVSLSVAAVSSEGTTTAAQNGNMDVYLRNKGN